MKIQKAVKYTTIVLLLCIVAGISMFLYNSYHSYNINSEFTTIPLNYNPDDSSSRYSWNGAVITVYGGFVKGIQHSSTGDSLVIRALSPLPSIEIQSSSSSEQILSILLENINPESFAAKMNANLKPIRVTVNTLALSLSLSPGELKRITPSQPSSTEDDNYIILGDSRDGYETFHKIVSQVNAINPVFVIDNGDLVYSGKPNQYRIFDQMVSGISTTLCTTLGNHDIRGSGREAYVKLYGPEYYSFDYGENHFIFLDSSRGYAEMQAIPEDQYAWLERDLQKAQGKQIYVISHVPSTDPRSNIIPNEVEAYKDKVKREGGLVEQELEDYLDNENIDHGFRNKQEAARFEHLMTQYKVNTVYLSHIHSYFDFNKDGVRYVISGGAGAELLTQNSYYHFLIAKTGKTDTLTMVQLPSPTNLLLQRYAATGSLFAQAMYRENQVAVFLFVFGMILLVLLLILLLVMKRKEHLTRFGILMKDTGKYMLLRHKELYKSKDTEDNNT